MTIRFMVLGAPRSGTTWAANWLTTERTLCLHDPLLEHAPEALDAIPCDRMLGVSCTALPLLPGFVNAHPAKKLILHRSRRQIDESLVAIGLSPLGREWDGALSRICGAHVICGDLFDAGTAKDIWSYLIGEGFDAARHAELVKMHVDPHFNRLPVVPERARDFARRVRNSLAA